MREALHELEEMEFRSATSVRVDTRAAVREAVLALRGERARPPDLVLAFVSPHHAGAYTQIPQWICAGLGDVTLAGGSALGVIGGGRELEEREALSLTAMWLPRAKVSVTHLATLPADGSRAGWMQRLGCEGLRDPHLLLLVDPYTFDPEPLLASLDAAFPEAKIFGGLLLGGSEASTALFAGPVLERSGALVVAFEGELELHTLLARGCRPIGQPLIVTRARGNVILELNEGRPMDVLRRLYEGLDARDRALFTTSLFAGVEITGKAGPHERGDFVIRHVLGIDPNRGAMAVDARLADYQVVQFHLRDAQTATSELAARLRTLSASEVADRVRGALLFSCITRGERLYGTSNHDSDEFAKRVGAASLSGFFCNGEIGPLGRRSFVHGCASVFTLFCAPRVFSQGS